MAQAPNAYTVLHTCRQRCHAYNPNTKETTHIEFETTSTGGKIYVAPSRATDILKITPMQAHASTAANMGDHLGTECIKYSGAVCNEDGSEVYLTPLP